MQVQEKLYTNAVCGNDPKLLEAIHQKENSIAIYQRNIQLLESNLSIAIEKDISLNVSGEVAEITAQLEVFFAENLQQCDTLLNDIIEVLKLFSELTKADSYRLLFSTVSSNMCRKFHTDINNLRLLCTYKGQGTLWVSEDENNRITDEEQPISEAQIHQANAGDILILKGALHPEGNPILHRSPTIEETGSKLLGKPIGKRLSKRLLLRLDTNEFLV